MYVLAIGVPEYGDVFLSYEEILRLPEAKDAVIYEQTTPRKLARKHGLYPDMSFEDFEDERLEWIYRLSWKYGWDGTLYRADYINEGKYTEIPVTPKRALEAFVKEAEPFYWAKLARVYETLEEAKSDINAMISSLDSMAERLTDMIRASS